jgi:serine protease Do
MTSDLEADLAGLATTLLASTVAVRSARGAGSGSGVVWSADGLIVTNAHVAQTAQLEIELADGRRLPGSVERRDERRDLASVRVRSNDEFTPATLRDPGNLRVGEFVAAFGHPLGVRNVLSTGIVHARYHAGDDQFVRADVKLAPGNSGGALADAQGRVVGINSMIAGGLALAVPADEVRHFLGEAAPAPRLGIRLARAQLGDGRSALVVLGTEPESAAERSGLLAGDVLVTRDLRRLAETRSLAVLRGGKPLTITIVGVSNGAAAAA